ncbi:MAG: histidinol dehydrogenase [Bacteroidaceae bacterium]|nr:histidinol dehydrogenase [Bacteroidaceae bacterium]
MKVVRYPNVEDCDALLKRPAFDVTQLFATVGAVVDAVRREGDTALRRYELQFDRVALDSLLVSDEEFYEAMHLVDAPLKEAVRLANANIERFHRAQTFSTIRVETSPGVVCEQKSVPIERVGLYVPGGTAPLFSTVLMLATPAKIAGCSEIVLCTPPDSGGRINPAILFAARLAGVSKVFKLGGAQAVAAMACGTESVPRVDKIFGPGNQYVMAAKQLVSLTDVAIDMPAGPSEVEVLADSSANAAFVAADLLSQAEHGADSQVVLVSTDEDLLRQVQQELAQQLAELPRRELAEKALSHSVLILVRNMDEAVALTNRYAPEHLVVATADYRKVAERITHAGSVFLGPYSCESAGDYASGTNHTLPTKGYARAYSGLCLDSFMRKMTLQELSAEGVAGIGPAVVAMARAERLDAHSKAMEIRLNHINR